MKIKSRDFLTLSNFLKFTLDHIQALFQKVTVTSVTHKP